MAKHFWRKSWLKQVFAHLDGRLFEKPVVMIDSSSVTTDVDGFSDVSDEAYDCT